MLPDSEMTRQLLRDARAGCAEAVNQLLERHRDSLRRMVQARLDRAISQRVDASDVVQDVLLEAHGRLSEFIENGSMPFHLWLRHLARDRMLDVHRRHRAQRRSSKCRSRLPAVSRSQPTSCRRANSGRSFSKDFSPEMSQSVIFAFARPAKTANSCQPDSHNRHHSSWRNREPNSIAETPFSFPRDSETSPNNALQDT